MGIAVDISDVLVKIKRAEEHFGELDRKIREWLDSNHVGIVHDHDPETGWHEIRGKHVPNTPAEWGAIVGDLGYNLRAALEYIAELLIIANRGTPNRQNQFPIISRIEDAHLIAVHLAGAHPDAIVAITNRQPYMGRKGTKRHPLEVVSELANIDKHHRLHASVLITEMGRLNWFKISPSVAGTFVDVAASSQAVQPIGDADLLGFHFMPADAKVEVKVDDSRPLPVAIEFRNGGSFRIDVLPDCISEVRAILEIARPYIEMPTA